MEAQKQRQRSSLLDQLLSSACRFGFYQAVRLIEMSGARQAVGGDESLEPKRVTFRAVPSLNFSASSVVELLRRANAKPERPEFEMIVSFLGLTGPAGAMPHHYTRLLIERVDRDDHALKDFLDIFNHRIISLYFRAWEKSHCAAAFERSHLAGTKADPFTACLFSLIGFGTHGLRGRMKFEDEVLLLYAGLYGDRQRPTIGLRNLLSDYFNVPVDIRQFQGQWLALSVPDQSALPSADDPNGRYCQLGVDLLLGDRVWDVQGKFRVRVGPLSYTEFRPWIPIGEALRPLCQLVRTYVGVALQFEVQVVLKGSEIPPWHLGGTGANDAFLGWTTWLTPRSAEAAGHDSEDAVFVLEDICTAGSQDGGVSELFSSGSQSN